MASSTRIESTLPREEVRGHGALYVREVWEGVFHTWELLRGAHEGGQVIGYGYTTKAGARHPRLSREPSAQPAIILTAAGTVWVIDFGELGRRDAQIVLDRAHALD